MNGILAIARKELRSYFYSPVAYVVIGVFLLVMGVIFAKFVAIYQAYNTMQRFGQAPAITLDKLAGYLYQNMAFILCFLTPFLTMRLFAEEKRQNTFELLFTAPITGWQLVLGKFLAAFSLLFVMVSLSGLYVFFMVLWGNPDLRIIGTTYIGLLMALSCYLALGALISATTSSQAIAAIFTFVTLLLLWLMQSIGQGMTTEFGPVKLGPLLTYLSPLSHFGTFAEGLVHVKDVVYFVTITFLLLFTTLRVVESNRWR